MFIFEPAFNIVFSVLLLPVNLFCSSWMFQETLKLSGMTFREFLNHLQDKVPSIPGSTLGRQRAMAERRSIILSYLLETSSNPTRTRTLFKGYCYGVIPGFLALSLMSYTGFAVRNADQTPTAFIGNLLLLTINAALFVIGKIYKSKNPLDMRAEEKLEQKRKKERRENSKNRIKNTIVYTMVGAFFLAVLLFFGLGMAGIIQVPQAISKNPQTSITQTIDFHDVNTVLVEKGFETANIPTTFWSYHENKLENVCAGVKSNSKFEYYEYTDNEAASLVYDEIMYDLISDEKANEQDKQETSLSHGGKMFTAVENGVDSLVLFQNNTVVYAHSPENLDEIREILTELGYLK